MHPNVLLPALTSLLGFGFAGVLLARFVRRRRQPYYLVWGLGLVWYALAAGAEALGGAQGWTPALYRTWYVTGAIGVAAFLGAGHAVPASRARLRLTDRRLAAGSLRPGPGGPSHPDRAARTGRRRRVTAVLTWRPGWFAHAVFAVLVLATVLAARQVLNADGRSQPAPDRPGPDRQRPGVRRRNPRADPVVQHRRRARAGCLARC